MPRRSLSSLPPSGDAARFGQPRAAASVRSGPYLHAIRDMHAICVRMEAKMDGTTKPLKTATYLLRFTPEEKAELEQKVRVAAALGESPLTLAEALRMGAHAELDRLIAKLKKDATKGEPGGIALS